MAATVRMIGARANAGIESHSLINDVGRQRTLIDHRWRLVPKRALWSSPRSQLVACIKPITLVTKWGRPPLCELPQLSGNAGQLFAALLAYANEVSYKFVVDGSFPSRELAHRTAGAIQGMCERCLPIVAKQSPTNVSELVRTDRPEWIGPCHSATVPRDRRSGASCVTNS
jgi:hypothetical protein